MSVLDFDAFPSSPEEQLSLIRFRLKKTLPFDIDSAAVSYFAQPAEKGVTIEVVAVIVALEIIARYEALFRAMNFHAGEVTTSALQRRAASVSRPQAASGGRQRSRQTQRKDAHRHGPARRKLSSCSALRRASKK